jgi:peptide/nickel transport system substrate-binding protein
LPFSERGLIKEETHMLARRFALVVGLLAIVVLAISCAAPAAQIVEKQVPVAQTVVVEKQTTVEKTVVVEKSVEKQVVVTATPAPTAAPKKGGTLIVARAADAKGLDPHKQTAFSSFRLLELIYEPLLALDANLKVVPLLADSYSWSADGQTLTMKIHPGVKFHNGDVMTADDVVFTFQRILDEKNAAAARSSFTDITDVKASDPATVVFTLKRPNASILAAMTNPNSAILSKKVVSADDPAKVTVGTGPFKLTKWEPDKTTTLAGNKDYWQAGVPALDGIEIRTIPDEASILAGLRAGTIDWALVNDPKVAIRSQGGNTKLTVFRTPALAYHVLQLNSTRKPFDNAKVRQAISCAIDRQEVVDTASLGEGQVTGPSTSPFYRLPNEQLTCYTKDLEQAKKLLADAGTGLKFTVIAANDEPPTAIAEAQNIQAQLKPLGITVQIESLELGVYVDRWLKGDFDAAVALNGGNPDPDIMFYRYWHSTGNLNKVAAWSDPKLDKLLDDGRVTVDPEKRKTIYNDVQKTLVDNAPWVWLYVGYEYRLMQPYVKNFTPMSNGSLVYLKNAWLDK